MKISIAMATCNGQAHIDAQLESIRQQRRQPDELVVSDDASDDQTLEKLNHFKSHAPFPVRVIENLTRQGVSSNFAKAIQHCGGDWIALADQDDIWLSDKLEVLSGAIDSPSVCLVFSDALLGDGDARPKKGRQWARLGFSASAQRRLIREPFEELLRFNVVTGMTMMFHASLVPLVLPIPDIWVPDEWIALLASACGEIRPVDRPLVIYRQHLSQQIGGAPQSWLAQWRYARQHMDGRYMQRQSERARLAAERLNQSPHQLRRPDASEWLRRKAEHYAGRIHPRWTWVCRSAMAGDYRRYGYGWKSVLQDLFLR